MIWLFQAQFSSKVTLEMKYLSSVCRRENISRVLKFSSILSTESLFYRIVLGTVDHIGLNRQEKEKLPCRKWELCSVGNQLLPEEFWEHAFRWYIEGNWKVSTPTLSLRWLAKGPWKLLSLLDILCLFVSGCRSLDRCTPAENCMMWRMLQ